MLVGTLDGVVTGFGLCHVEDRGPAGCRGVLDACYVEVGARGLGLGRLLLDTSVSWLEEQGCRGVDGIALPGDRGAKNFYESAGFKARLLTMHRHHRLTAAGRGQRPADVDQEARRPGAERAGTGRRGPGGGGMGIPINRASSGT